jgi:hypothetical protein
MIIIFWEMTPCGSKSSNLSLSSLPIEEYYVRFEPSTAVTKMIINSPKMINIIVTAVETSNLTNSFYCSSSEDGPE